ncbi:MAG: DUF975 family protein [Eubacterium sp.]
MNKINRPLVKSQARQIIKGKVFYLFIISFIVSILTGMSASYNLAYNSDDIYNGIDNYYSDDYYDNFSNSNNGENPIEGFTYNSANSNADVSQLAVKNVTAKPINASMVFSSGLGGLVTVAAIIFAPLTVTLAGMYVSLIRKNANEKFDFGKELGGIFKNSFNDTYGKKLVLIILLELITILLCILFIIPGIIFSYSAYFSLQIMNDYPNLKPSEAIKLSKKMVKGNRSELFIYDLSFIPWYLLMAITFGLVGIYVIPYKSTSNALYYENFRLRALAEGRITEDDFLSEQERIMKYSSVDYNNGYQQNPYYTPNTGNAQNTASQPYQEPAQNVVNSDGTFYSPDFSPVEQYNPYANSAQPQGGGYYYAPQQPEQQAPTQQAASVQPPAEEPREQYYDPPASQQTTYYNPHQENDYNIPMRNTTDNTENNEQ